MPDISYQGVLLADIVQDVLRRCDWLNRSLGRSDRPPVIRELSIRKKIILKVTRIILESECEQISREKASKKTLVDMLSMQLIVFYSDKRNHAEDVQDICPKVRFK
ncbi:hypothetical protein CEXT_418781 [Caerostris extrusa]|uniref:Uncharacterized protein n=1 Tax=Caerostris extrusa TaxID=172846 RepID=A0AAV4TEI1_CAEEX|nr:hypothetical protein CEXT_418781 [Caerostris extrusa]